MPLATPHHLSDYYKVTSDSDQEVKGVVYIETDVRYDAPTGAVASWAKGPLDEIGFLRKAVAGEYGPRDNEMLLGLVPWAPMDQPTLVLEEYLKLAEDRAGTETWKRVKGFRFLLQAILDQSKFETLIFSNDFIANLQLLGKRRFSFDIGVDQHSGGSWQLQAISKAMKMAHAGVAEDEKIVFVINHLCKPEFEHIFPQNPGALQGLFDEWCDGVSAMAKRSRTYMKLSGAFSELPPNLGTAKDIAAFIKPWVEHVLQTFGPRRTMFGSDWPVCNLKGPLGKHSWVAWKDVLMAVLSDKAYDLSDEDRERIWSGTASEAYGLP